MNADSRPPPLLQLIGVQDVLGRARREDETGVDAVSVAVGEAMAHHRAQRNQAGAPGDQQQRPAVLDVPRERPPAGPADLEAITGPQLAREMRGDLALRQSLDGELELGILRGRGERVGALGPVAVLGGQAHVDTLPGAVPGPARYVEHEGADARRLVSDRGHRRRVPGLTPARSAQSSS